ncbi:hypothetical protein GZ22_18525 (plasmid) [Terribacillus saccharophilus]|uniref:DUF5050 domain-containing protein n=1 Tax=Terribacillus saccharophilus TaxID=361277 RepID=A0A075LQM0_9BACI|nr:hypothetical protein [Terribacillus goriensis]AIF68421.1 hypothetical protein GZ22_18525 [Terribacillus goriensis]
MNKLLMSSFLIVMIVLSACGKNDSSDDTDAAAKPADTPEEVIPQASTLEEPVTETTSKEEDAALQQDAAPQTLTLQEKVDQVGNSTLFSSNAQDYKGFEIIEKDGYTYFIYDSKDHDLAVSVEKDNKWVAEDVPINITDSSLPKDSLGDRELISSGDSLLYNLEVVGESDYHVVYKLTFDPTGSVTAELVKQTEDGEDADLVQGSDGKAYIFNHIQDSSDYSYERVLMNDKGEELYSLKNMEDGVVDLLDVHNGVIYQEDTVYDIKVDDFIWDEHGQEMSFDLNFDVAPSNVYKSNIADLYKLDTYLCAGCTDGMAARADLSYSTNGTYETTEISKYTLPTEAAVYDATMVVGEDSINVYSIVEFKGNPTLQKYTIGRIDQPISLE